MEIAKKIGEYTVFDSIADAISKLLHLAGKELSENYTLSRLQRDFNKATIDACHLCPTMCHSKASGPYIQKKPSSEIKTCPNLIQAVQTGKARIDFFPGNTHVHTPRLPE